MNLTDDVVAKFNSSGVCQWVLDIPTQAARDVHPSCDAAGYVYSSGRVDGSSTLSFCTATGQTVLTNTLTALGSPDDVFRLKLDGSGNVIFYNNYGNAGCDSAPFWSISDSAGNGYAVGYINGTTTTFGSAASHSTGGARDVFVLATDSNGNVLWAKEATGSAGDTGYGVAVNSNDVVALGGYFASVGSPATEFGTMFTPTNGGGGTGGFVTHLNPNNQPNPASTTITSPLLSISISGKQVTISWPVSSAAGFVLQSTTSLSSPNWTAVPGVVNNSVTVTAAATTFYRLQYL